MAKKTTKTASLETLEPRVYEIGFLMSPAVREEDLASRVDEIKESLTKNGAVIISEGNPEFIDLAYEMIRVIDNKNVRFNQGYFGWVKFEVDPTAIATIKEQLEKNVLIIRFLLIKTIRENTVVGKKSLGKILKGKRNDAEFDEAVVDDIEPVSEEQLEQVLDEEIKELVKEI